MSYHFRILGPVGLTRHGQEITIGPAKRRAMLAALLLDANQPVRLPGLAAAVWSGLPPASAVANLRSHASVLRRVLDGRLVARSRAYELRVERGELDAFEFERLARAGQEALAAADPVTATARLREALALWRGRAGANLPGGTSLAARLAALDQQRLDVFDDFIGARLHTRAYPQLATDLRRHLAVCPVRERSWTLLMLTLYRAGNTPDALSAYAQARTVLRDHLGIEPGPELQRLHRRVLERDPSLDDPPPPPQPGPHAAPAAGASGGAGDRPAIPSPRRPLAQPLTPHQLPPDLVVPVGRDRELAAITGALRLGSGVVLVTGRAGVGKSTLAIHAAHLVADEYPDGRVAVDLAGAGPAPHPPAGVTATVLQALGLAPHQVPPGSDEQAAAYRSLTNGRRILILLDDAAGAAQLRPLLPGGAGATLLVTARRRPAALDGVRHVEIGALPEADAITLLSGYAGAARLASDPEAVRRLVELCDGLPLALQIVGERLARRPDLSVALLATHLTNRPLDGLHIDDLSARDALAADHRAVTAEDPVAARVLPLLGQLAPQATTTPEALAEQLGEEPSRTFHALEHLVDASLADSPQPGRYRAAGLAHAYAAELAATDRTTRTSRPTNP